MRVKNSVINVSISMLAQIITVILGFVTQKVFIQTLGTEILGINGLFSNIISMLSIAELGIGTAVIYNLYKPLAENDTTKINKWMKFYKSCYRKIAMIISLLGIICLPFIGFFVGEVNTTYNIYILYLLYLTETVVSYLFTYKRSILYADQKNYIITLIHVLYLVLVNTFQIIILLFTKNYILYLIIKIIMRLVENLLINIATIKKYPYIKNSETEELEKSEKKSFYKELKGLVFHKISWIVIGGTDNIIISKFVGITWVGIYSNYLMITNTIEQLVAQMFSAITGSVGNLLTSETKEKAYEVYKKTSLLQYVIYSTATVGIFCVSEPFIRVWLANEEFIFSRSIVFFICISFFFCGMRRNICVFKDAAGIFYEDRKMPIIASLLNIVFSIILAMIIGIQGVFIGTIICYLFLHICSYSKYIYEKVFEKKRKEYLKELLKYTLILLLSMFVSNVIVQNTYCSNTWIELIKTIIISILTTNIITIVVFRKTAEYNYWKDFILGLIRKLKQRIKK